MREQIWQAVLDVRARLAGGWVVWETTDGPMWARFKSAHQIVRAPITEDEEAVVDYVLREEDDAE